MRLVPRKQMDIFSMLVKLKSSTAGHLAQKTGMHRQSVRIILANLEQKGFVSKRRLKNNIIYKSEELDDIRRKYREELLSNKKIIPKLSADYEESKDTQVINAVKGRKGLETVLLDEIIKGKEIKAFTLSSMDAYKEELKANDERRKKNNIMLKMLTNPPTRIPFSEIKKTDLKSKINVYVYANKITILYNDKDMNIFTMKIKEITKLFSDIFDNHWK
jgi:sugar-specific transcriptional regulator TrmB